MSDNETSGSERSDDPHADDFCVVCGRSPETGLTMHPVVSIENGTVCEVCTHRFVDDPDRRTVETQTCGCLRHQIRHGDREQSETSR